MLTDSPFSKDAQGTQVPLAQKENKASQEQKVRPQKAAMNTVVGDGFGLEPWLGWHWLLRTARELNGSGKHPIQGCPGAHGVSFSFLSPVTSLKWSWGGKCHKSIVSSTVKTSIYFPSLY